MRKLILTFSWVLFLSACAGVPVKQIPAQVRDYKKVNFFAGEQKTAAFKVTGKMNNLALEGVLRIDKLGADDFEVLVLTGGAYRALHATVGPEGVAYLYLFPDADTALVRSRITQFLNLLLLDPGVYKSHRTSGPQLRVTYHTRAADTRFFYQIPNPYPQTAQTVTLLNTAQMNYGHYAPADAAGERLVPHGLVYRDGKIELDLTLISLK